MKEAPSVGNRGGGSRWSPLVTNRPSVAPADVKSRLLGDLRLTKRFRGFDSRLVLGPVIPKTKNGSDPSLHGTYDEVGP